MKGVCEICRAMKAWLSKMLSEANGNPSTKRVVFTVSVLVVLGYVGVSIFRRFQIDENAKDLCKFIVGATSAAYGIGRCAEAHETVNTTPT